MIFDSFQKLGKFHHLLDIRDVRGGRRVGTVSYAHTIATMAFPRAVSTQHTNVTDTQLPNDSNSRAMQPR